MKRNMAIGIFILSVFILSCFGTSVFAERPVEGIGKWLQEVGVFSGYITGDLKEKEDLRIVPLGMRFGFDLKPFTKKFGFNPKGMLEMIYEPFINHIIAPKSNVELGLAFLFRYSYPLTGKLYPYIEAGSGLHYMTLQTREQSTQFNFIDQGGGGITYFLKKNLALDIGYRFRHISNAGIKEPNGGINANVYTVGLAYYY